MRISDWSSYVCSSDLQRDHLRIAVGIHLVRRHVDTIEVGQAGAVVLRQADEDVVILVIRRPPGAGLLAGQQRAQCIGAGGEAEAEVGGERAGSDERRVGKEWGSPCSYRWAPDH